VAAALVLVGWGVVLRARIRREAGHGQPDAARATKLPPAAAL